MLNLTVAVILHGITLTGNIGSIDSASCPIAAHALSGDNWVVSCANNSPMIGMTSGTNWWSGWSTGGCSINQYGNVICP